MSIKRIHILDTHEKRTKDGVDEVVGCGIVVPKAVAIPFDPEDDDKVCKVCKSIIQKAHRHYVYHLIPGQEARLEVEQEIRIGEA